MYMIENQMYAVFLFLKKDKRVDIAYQVLDLVEGDPPELGIKYVLSTLNKIKMGFKATDRVQPSNQQTKNF